MFVFKKCPAEKIEEGWKVRADGDFFVFASPRFDTHKFKLQSLFMHLS